MRRIAVLTSILTLVLAFYFKGPAEGAVKRFSVAVGTIAGTMARLGTGMTEIFNKNSKDVRLNIIPGGGRTNPVRVATGKADFGFTYSNFAYMAYSGQKPFERKFPMLRGVVMIYKAAYHQYIAREVFDGGIRSWGDIIKSKRSLRLGVSGRGSSTEWFSRNVLTFYGLAYDDLRKRGFTITHTGTGENSRAYQARQLDIWFHNGGPPNAAGIRATMARPTTFMRMPKEVAGHLAKLGAGPATIPANSYEGQTEPVHTVGLSGMVLTATKMDPGVVYSLLKIMHANKKFLGRVHRLYKNLDVKTSGKSMFIPLHEGARRFYTEQGVRLP
ncbi:TAXI family TRAP transporter solute-binding subunit [Nitrospinota bacterium]